MTPKEARILHYEMLGQGSGVLGSMETVEKWKSRNELIHALIDLYESSKALRYKNKFDCTVVEAND